ncbi:MAG: CRISPR-associated endonuclease Cas3'' [Thermoguttaceae bacterium]|jgi:CRISPR-associated endonuclease Cas3-HD
MMAAVSYLAHSVNGNGSGVTEPLRDHLLAVAQRAGRFAVAFGAEEQAYAAGLVHDLGKYADQFLRRLSDPREPGRDHWTVASALLLYMARSLWHLPALAVAGHPRVLCIVNLKTTRGVPGDSSAGDKAKGMAHLSTHMCPRHRERGWTRSAAAWTKASRSG